MSPIIQAIHRMKRTIQKLRFTQNQKVFSFSGIRFKHVKVTCYRRLPESILETTSQTLGLTTSRNFGFPGQTLGQKNGGWDHFLGFLKNRRKNENYVKKSKIMSKKPKIHQKMTPKKWFLAPQRTPRKSIFSPPRGADFSIFRFSSRCGVWTEFTEFRIF